MVSWNEINAYVDGELDAESLRRIAAAMEGDPSLAARVATIGRLKAVTVRFAPVNEAALLPDGLVILESPKRRSWGPLVVAASLALLLVAGSAERLGQPAVVGSVVALSSTERIWLSGTGTAIGGAVARHGNSANQNLGLPDLSEADLHLSYLALGPNGNGDITFAGYTGPNGCRLGLWSGTSDGSEYPPTPRDYGTIMIRAWSDGRRTFAVVSQSMNVDRLDRVTALVADLTSRNPAIEKGYRTALYVAARARMPCLG